MSAVTQSHLDWLYARGDDPWSYRRSDYEAGKFAATLAALPRDRYGWGLELGCGNGELARRLAPRCATYTGLDAVGRALGAARMAVPGARFVEGLLPCPLPEPPDAAEPTLIVLSEVLYFLDRPGIAAVAADLDACHPDADLLCVTWRGPSGYALDGDESLELFLETIRLGGRSVITPRIETLYRIDLVTSVASKAAKGTGTARPCESVGAAS